MLKGRTAIVTGGSRGIGKAIALEVAKQGADIAIIYSSNFEEASETVRQITDLGRRCECYKCDISDFALSKDMTQEIIKTFGNVEILINNAGIVRDKLLLSMNEEDFDRVISVNLKGTFNMTKHISRHMMSKRFGRIINISSVIGLIGNAGQANYSAAKAGIIGFTKSVAKELGSRGITCNAIAPGFIETDMTKGMNDKAKDMVIANVPMKKVGKPEDIALTAAFLCGDGASYITGEVLRVDGGLAM